MSDPNTKQNGEMFGQSTKQDQGLMKQNLVHSSSKENRGTTGDRGIETSSADEKERKLMKQNPADSLNKENTDTKRNCGKEISPPDIKKHKRMKQNLTDSGIAGTKRNRDIENQSTKRDCGVETSSPDSKRHKLMKQNPADSLDKENMGTKRGHVKETSPPGIKKHKLMKKNLGDSLNEETVLKPQSDIASDEKEPAGFMDWILKLQNKHCPPTSYDNSNRSSRCIVDAYTSNGNACAVFSNSKDFRAVYACEDNKSQYESLKNKFHLNQKVHCINGSFVDWYNKSYASQASQALVYLNLSTIPIPPSKKTTALFLPDKPKELCALVKTMLSGKNKCPMLILKLPLWYNTSKLLELPAQIKENHKFHPNPHQFVVLIGYRNKISPTPHSFSYVAQSSAPSASSCQQITWLWNQKNGSQHHLYQRLVQLLCMKLKGCRQSHDIFVERLKTIIVKDKIKNDEKIYDELANHFHTKTVQAYDYKRNASKFYTSTGRANYRVTQVVRMLYGSNWKPRNLLDVGCAEGSITAALGKEGFNLNEEDIHGCDVRDQSTLVGFKFSFYDGKKLPYADNSFDLVIAFMVLHHIENCELIIQEIFRVLRPNGRFILREHDCFSPQLGVVLDVMHGLYARTWSKPPEQPQFCESYYAKYRDRKEWTKLLTHYGFKQCWNSPDSDQKYRKPRFDKRQRRWIKNPWMYYFGIYTKKTSTSQVSTSRYNR